MKTSPPAARRSFGARLGLPLVVLAAVACAVPVLDEVQESTPIELAASSIGCVPDSTPAPTPTPSPSPTASASTTPTPSPTTSPAPKASDSPSEVPTVGTTARFVHANIKSGESMKDLTYDLRQVFKNCPDFITYNEVPYRQPTLLAPEGYAIYRTPGQYTGEAPVVWNTSRWTAVARGTSNISNKYGMLPGQHVHWGVRYANWVTLTSVDGLQTVSIVAVHIAPKSSITTKLLVPSIRNLGALVGALSSAGPVMVGGDFNRHYKSKEYPRTELTAAGLTPTYDITGTYLPTGDHFGATIDYVFVRPAPVFTVHEQKTVELRSDHDLLSVVLGLPAVTAGEPVVSFSPGTMVNDPYSLLSRARGSIARTIISAVRHAPEGSDIRVMTSQITMPRVVAALRLAAARGVRVRVVSAAPAPTVAEQRLSTRFAQGSTDSWVRNHPEAFASGSLPATTVIFSQAGATRRLVLTSDHALTPTMLTELTRATLGTRKKGYQASLKTFAKAATAGRTPQPTAGPTASPTTSPTGQPTTQPTSTPAPA